MWRKNLGLKDHYEKNVLVLVCCVDENRNLARGGDLNVNVSRCPRVLTRPRSLVHGSSFPPRLTSKKSRLNPSTQHHCLLFPMNQDNTFSFADSFLDPPPPPLTHLYEIL